MFEQATRDPSRQGWSFAGSLALQAAGTAVLLLVPLLNTYEIDLGAWARNTVRIAVPAPPAPPAPAPPPTQAPPARYSSTFAAPTAIPDRVAVLDDAGLDLAPLGAGAAPSGMEGGLGRPGVPGVLGMEGLASDGPPLPPPVRVGGRVQNARMVHREMPVYPPEAVEQYVSGTVKLEAIIGIDGNVRDVRLISGHPMLVRAAMEAVAQWRYRPTRLNGRVVEVVTLVDVNFNLTVVDEKELKRRRREARRQSRSN